MSAGSDNPSALDVHRFEHADADDVHLGFDFYQSHEHFVEYFSCTNVHRSTAFLVVAMWKSCWRLERPLVL